MTKACNSHKSVHCSTCEGREVNSVFCSLNGEALKILDENKSINLFKKNQYVFHAGSDAQGLYCINSGVVRLESDSKTGAGHIHRVVSKGGILGYRSLFANESYTSSAFVQEDAVVCHIPKAAIFRLISIFPEVGFSFLSHVSKDLRNAEDRHRNLMDKEAPRRVAETLLQLKKNFPEIHWTRKEIAEWADTTPETVMRCFSDFKDRGFITVDGRKVEIKDQQAFLKFIDPPY